MSTQPLAVIMVASFLDPGQKTAGAGGRPRIVRDLARHLVDRGFRVEVLQKGAADGATTLEPGVTVTSVAAPLRAWGDLVFALRTRRAVQAADLCCYATPEDGFPFFARNSFAIQHGVWWDGPPYGGLKGALVRAVQRARNLAMCSRTKRVICVDSNFPNLLRALGGAGYRAAAKCSYVANYVDLEQFPAPVAATIAARFADRKLLFLRRFEPPRGAELFVETCRRLRDRGFRYSAEMIGWGSQESRLRDEIRRWRLEDRIALRRRGLDQVREAIDSSALSVAPSLWSEGTSLSAIESIASGVPVVVSDVGGLPNVVIPQFNGAVAAASPEAMAEAVIDLLSDQQRYVRMSLNCLAMRGAFALDLWKRKIDHLLTEAGLLAEPAEAAQARAASRQKGGLEFSPSS